MIYFIKFIVLKQSKDHIIIYLNPPSIRVRPKENGQSTLQFVKYKNVPRKSTNMWLGNLYSLTSYSPSLKGALIGAHTGSCRLYNTTGMCYSADSSIPTIMFSMLAFFDMFPNTNGSNLTSASSFYQIT